MREKKVKMILTDHIVVDGNDHARGDIVDVKESDVDLLLSMKRALKASSEEGKDFAAAEKKAAAKKKSEEKAAE